MIKIKRVAEVPDILKLGLTPKSKGEAAREYLCDSYEQGKTEFGKTDFDEKIYKDETVTKVLFDMQHGKCCYCECETESVSHRREKGDVEHFRPKNGYKQNKGEKTISKPGYYWLAYEWTNLLWSCAACNRNYKINLFPLENSTVRAINHHDDVKNEIPLLINPCEQNPEDFISFHAEVPYSINDNPYGIATIEILNLRDDLVLAESRKKVLKQFDRELDFIKIAARNPNNQELQQLAKEAQQAIQEMSAPQAEYSAMIKAALSKTLQ
jgi:uncharacterized protein (TIGR02646 family)